MLKKEPMRVLRRLLNHHESAHCSDPRGPNSDMCFGRGDDQPSLCYEADEARRLLGLPLSPCGFVGPFGEGNDAE